MLAITGVSNVNGVKRAAHTVAVVFALRDAAVYAAVDGLLHIRPPYA